MKLTSLFQIEQDEKAEVSVTDEISDDKFKSDVMRFIEVAAQKFDGVTSDLRSNSFKIDRIEAKVDRVESDLKDLSTNIETLSRKFNAVGVVGIDDHQRVDKLEQRVMKAGFNNH